MRTVIAATIAVTLWACPAPGEETFTEGGALATWLNDVNSETGRIFAQLYQEMGTEWRREAILGACEKPIAAFDFNHAPLRNRVSELSLEYPLSTPKGAATLIAVQEMATGFRLGYIDAMRFVFKAGAMDPNLVCKR